MKLILDTNVVSEARKSTCHPNVRAWLAAQANDDLFISSITVLEIQRGITQAAQRGDAHQATTLTRWLDELVLPAFENRFSRSIIWLRDRPLALPGPMPGTTATR